MTSKQSGKIDDDVYKEMLSSISNAAVSFVQPAPLEVAPALNKRPGKQVEGVPASKRARGVSSLKGLMSPKGTGASSSASLKALLKTAQPAVKENTGASSLAAPEVSTSTPTAEVPTAVEAEVDVPAPSVGDDSVGAGTAPEVASSWVDKLKIPVADPSDPACCKVTPVLRFVPSPDIALPKKKSLTFLAPVTYGAAIADKEMGKDLAPKEMVNLCFQKSGESLFCVNQAFKMLEEQLASFANQLEGVKSAKDWEATVDQLRAERDKAFTGEKAALEARDLVTSKVTEYEKGAAEYKEKVRSLSASLNEANEVAEKRAGELNTVQLLLTAEGRLREEAEIEVGKKDERLLELQKELQDVKTDVFQATVSVLKLKASERFPGALTDWDEFFKLTDEEIDYYSKQETVEPAEDAE